MRKMTNRTEELKKAYELQQHPEGGWFAEVYTAPFERNGRPLAGSIYFLLDSGEISHFHQIDCDEIWYHHEGCAVKITAITDGNIREYLLGQDIENCERAMVAIPKGTIFAAENLDKNGYCFMSCATTPKFTYEGFRLVGETEIKEIYGMDADKIIYLAYR